MDKTSLGDRMKSYERRTSHNFLPMLPVMARMDGKSFHTFTKGLKRPYDVDLSALMVEVTKFLVSETDACCGYTQSDEITLVWLSEDYDREIFFSGKMQKIISITSSLTSVKFNELLPKYLKSKVGTMAIFDSRVWQLPSKPEAVNNFIWREQDATRNSIQMAAQSMFSHKELQNKNCSELQDMMHSKGVNWNDYPRFFKRGTYVRRRVVERPFTAKELDSLPPKHHARINPDLKIRRTVVMEEDIPPLTKIDNRVDFILHGADPILKSEKGDKDVESRSTATVGN